MRFVDSHMHLWHLTEHKWYPALDPPEDSDDFGIGDMASLRRDYLPEHYLADAAGSGLDVVKAVHVSAVTAPRHPPGRGPLARPGRHRTRPGRRRHRRRRAGRGRRDRRRRPRRAGQEPAVQGHQGAVRVRPGRPGHPAAGRAARQPAATSSTSSSTPARSTAGCRCCATSPASPSCWSTLAGPTAATPTSSPPGARA
ncbi:hypothetical protein ACFSTC_62665 [Nonomuraea ferruginea]